MKKEIKKLFTELVQNNKPFAKEMLNKLEVAKFTELENTLTTKDEWLKVKDLITSLSENEELV